MKRKFRMFRSHASKYSFQRQPQMTIMNIFGRFNNIFDFNRMGCCTSEYANKQKTSIPQTGSRPGSKVKAHQTRKGSTGSNSHEQSVNSQKYVNFQPEAVPKKRRRKRTTEWFSTSNIKRRIRKFYRFSYG